MRRISRLLRVGLDSRQIKYLEFAKKLIRHFIRHFRELSILLAVNALGLPAVTSRKKPTGLIYLDAGTHADGLQLQSMLDWFSQQPITAVGFEANPNSFLDCVTNVPTHPNLTLINVALVGPAHEGDTATLWAELPSLRTNRVGVGDSLFLERGIKRGYAPMRVPARRLSQCLKDLNLDLQDNRVILRMNIEGAELGVLQDLAAEDLLPLIDMFMGTWDDAKKIDHELGRALKRFMRNQRIIKVPFANNHYSGVLAPLYLFLIRRTVMRLVE